MTAWEATFLALNRGAHWSMRRNLRGHDKDETRGGCSYALFKVYSMVGREDAEKSDCSNLEFNLRPPVSSSTVPTLKT